MRYEEGAAYVERSAKMARRLTQGQFIVRANKGHPRTKDTHTPDQHTRTEDTHTKTACASSSAPTPVLVRRPNGCPSRARRKIGSHPPHTGGSLFFVGASRSIRFACGSSVVGFAPNINHTTY